MTFSDLSTQPSKARIEQERIAKESAQLKFSTVDFRLWDITYAAPNPGSSFGTASSRSCRGRLPRSDGHDHHRDHLQTHFVGINGFLLEGWQHNDRRHNALTSVSEV